MKIILLLSVLGFFLQSPVQAQSIDFKTWDFELAISGPGQITAMRDPAAGRDFLAIGPAARLLRVQVANHWLEPVRASLTPTVNVVELTHPGAKVMARVQVTATNAHLVFHHLEVAPADEVNAVSWGPYPPSEAAAHGAANPTAPSR